MENNENFQLFAIDPCREIQAVPQEAVPAALVFGKTFYRLSSWKDLSAIFCYLAYQTDGGAAFFDSQKNAFLHFSHGECVSHDSVGARRKIVFCGFGNSYESDIKFAPDCYVRRLDPTDTVAVMRYVVRVLNPGEVKVYLGDRPDQKALSDDLLKSLNGRGKKNRYADKNGKYFLARINKEILLPQEKFYIRIDREFDRKVLIGDIPISEEEESYLREYMVRQFKRLNEGVGVSNYHLKVFAYGLVRFAMKYYSQKTFWPYFYDEYGIKMSQGMQSELHDVFRRIMTDNRKAYDDASAVKIDNISMHGFVTDRCANQLFDYLFDFWRLDLNRNIENIYGAVGKPYFGTLLEEIKANNAVCVSNVMKHTSMAVAMEEKSCRLRIRRILHLMDDCFWNQSEIPQTGNRINELLRKWMRLPDGKFQKEQKVVIAMHRGGRGETLLASPVLCAKFRENSFYVRFPREILKNYSAESEYPQWTIEIGEEIFSVFATPYVGKIGFYTEECALQIPPNLLFREMKISLNCARKVYTVKADRYRFFSENGALLNYKKNLPIGLSVVYAETARIPQKLYGEETIAKPVGDMFAATYEIGERDILLFPDKSAVQAGQQIREGLIGTPSEGVVSVTDGQDTPIYNRLPKFLFRAKREQLAGVALLVENGRGQSETWRVKENFVEFKLDDKLDDVYGYLIDLSDYIKEDGFYRFRLSLPASSSVASFQFIYLKNLNFKFIGSPYRFENAGKLAFSADAAIETNGEWEITANEKIFPFVFNTELRECSECVQGRDLCLSYLLPDRKILLKFRIPSFFWKYRKEEEWRTQLPADLSIRHLPDTLYFCGPFDCAAGKLSVDQKSAASFDETEISAEKIGGEDFYSFPLGNLKSFLDHSTVKRTVFITLNGKRIPFLNVICRSVVSNAGLSADYEAEKLIGRFEMIGDAEYCATVVRDGKIIGQEVPVRDGVFELETDSLGGDYLVKLYEIFEDDSGFDAELVKLTELRLKLTDITKLENEYISLVSIRDRKKEYISFQLSNSYGIVDLRYLGRYRDVCDLEVNGLWRLDFGNPDEMNRCYFYEGYLAAGEKLTKLFRVMVIFPDRLNLTECVILRKEGTEYLELLYDFKKHSLIPSDSQLTKLQKKERIVTLDDDKCTFNVRIGKVNPRAFQGRK